MSKKDTTTGSKHLKQNPRQGTMALCLWGYCSDMIRIYNNGRKCIKYHKNILTAWAPRGNLLNRGQEEDFSRHDTQRLCIKSLFRYAASDSTTVTGLEDLQVTAKLKIKVHDEIHTEFLKNQSLQLVSMWTALLVCLVPDYYGIVAWRITLFYRGALRRFPLPTVCCVFVCVHECASDLLSPDCVCVSK